MFLVVAAGKWLAELPKPVALLAANDVFAHFAAVGAVIAGIAVPEEIAILGVDNDTVLCQSTHVPLSSVAAPARRIGWVAAELLDKMIAGTPSPSGPVLIPPAPS